MTVRARILSGGVGHPFDETSGLVAELLDEVGIRAEVTEDVAGGAASLVDDPVDLLVVNALRWRMEAERYGHLRDEWAFTLPEASRSGILAHVDAGRSLFAVHTAVICFGDWSEWGELLGAAWDWESSLHPPLGTAKVTVDTGEHPIVAGIGDFEIVDEIYGFLDHQPDVVGLAYSRHGGRDHPLLWARRCRGARVVYDALGHDRRSFEHPSHRTIVRRAALWATGAPDREVASA